MRDFDLVAVDARDLLAAALGGLPAQLVGLLLAPLQRIAAFPERDDRDMAPRTVGQADRALRTGIITFNGNFEGLRQTTRFGDVLVLVNRPQEVVFALQLLKVAFDEYFTTVAEYNRAEFQMFHSLPSNKNTSSDDFRPAVRFFSGDDEENREGWVEPVDDRPDPEREIMAHQLRAAIERAERQLSAQQKVIFRLRHYENRSLEDIAQLLGLRAGTVRAHLFRAIHKIRKQLEAFR